MKAKGIDLRFQCNIAAISREDAKSGELISTLTDGTQIKCGAVMLATGRAPNSKGLGLEKAGVTLSDNGAVKVDAHFQTSVPSIHAIGDVTDRVLLTPVALAEGMAVAARLFGKNDRTLSYENIATAIFSNPNVGTVGLSEDAARRRGRELSIFKSSFTPLKHTLTGRTEKVLMKLVVDKNSDQVLGVHMVGPEAGEMIQGFAVALNCGATKSQLDATIGIHPTRAEEFVTMRQPVV